MSSVVMCLTDEWLCDELFVAMCVGVCVYNRAEAVTAQVTAFIKSNSISIHTYLPHIHTFQFINISAAQLKKLLSDLATYYTVA